MKKYTRGLPTAALSRRDFGRLIGGASTAAIAAGLMPRGAWAADYSGAQIVFASWGGIYQESQEEGFCVPFMEKTGATVIQDGPIDYAKLRLMVENGRPIWNVCDIGAAFLYAGTAEGLFEPIDTSIVDTSMVADGFVHEYGIGTSAWSYAIAYHKDEYEGGDHPKTWADLFDVEKFPGRRMLRDRPNPNLEIALLADGVAPEDLYPLDVERAFAKLESIREHLIFWTTNSQSQQLITDGEVTLGLMIHGRVYDLHKKGVPVGIEWDQTLVSSDYLVVPKGVGNKDASMALINEMLQPKYQVLIGEAMAGGPTSTVDLSGISEEAESWMPTAEANSQTAIMIDELYWQDNLKSLEEEWVRWKLS